jgi:hypothetical protein
MSRRRASLLAAGAGAVLAGIGGAAIAGAFADSEHGRVARGSATRTPASARPRTILVLT